LRQRYPALVAELIAGPLFRDWRLLRPVDRISMIPFEPNIASMFAEANLVIRQAGYNSVAELEQLGTKTILAPAERQWDDQFARAEGIARERKNFRVFRGKTSAELADQAAELLCEHIPNATATGAYGGIKAAQLIYEMLA
jgi:UDP-N-acetylglucosamine:LPS N-acetylglucosamine transferase